MKGVSAFGGGDCMERPRKMLLVRWSYAQLPGMN
jgi:hypothetical protein